MHEVATQPDRAEAIPSPAVAPPTPTEAILIAVWRDLFASDTVGFDDDFFALGGYSLLGARLLAQVEEHFGIALPFRQLIDTPTIRELAAAIDEQPLAGDARAGRSRALVALQPRGSRPPLCCIHAVDGRILAYEPLVAALGPDQPVYGLRAPGLYGGALPPPSLPEIAADYIAELRTVVPRGPYYLLGYSLGGTIAYEMAQQLRAAGAEVALLGMIDTLLPENFAGGGAPSAAGEYWWQLARRVPGHLRALRTMSPTAARAYIRPRWVYFSRRLKVRLQLRRVDTAVLSEHFQAAGQEATLGSFRGVAAILGLASHRYTLRPYPGRLIYFRSEQRANMGARAGWAEFARGGLDLYFVGGDHGTVMRGESAQRIARLLRRAIDASDRSRR